MPAARSKNVIGAVRNESVFRGWRVMWFNQIQGSDRAGERGAYIEWRWPYSPDGGALAKRRLASAYEHQLFGSREALPLEANEIYAAGKRLR